MASQQTPQVILPHLNWSLARLKEVIEKEDTEYYRGAALQRFRFTYEVALKVICVFAKQEGKIFPTDDACFQWVEEKQWLKNKSDWTAVIKSYKKVKSLPKEKSTDRIYNELPAHYALLHDMNESMNLALSKKP